MVSTPAGLQECYGGTEYEQLVNQNGKLILQLHHWDVQEHPHMGDPATKPYGNGVLLWFQIEDFGPAVAQARALSAEILEGPRVNPNANHRQIWLRDPNGYVVVLASGYDDI